MFASGQEGMFRNPDIWGGVRNSVRLQISVAIIDGFLELLIGCTMVRTQGSELSIKLGGVTEVETNDAVWVDFGAAKMNYYDPKTEKLLRIV